MVTIKNTIKSFVDRGGHFIFSSMMISKILNFVLSLIIVRILTQETYGNISYALSIIVVILPFSGFGLHHAMLRFGSIEKTHENKNNLFLNLFKWGLLFATITALILYLISPLITINLPDSNAYLRLLTPLIISSFSMEVLFSLFRVHKNNVLYSWGVILKAILVLVLCFISANYFGPKAYVITYAFVPAIAFILIFIPGNKIYHIKKELSVKIEVSPYLKYGIWVGLGSIASQLVMVLDAIMVGNIIANSAQLAIYKVATIIPVNLLFIPTILLNTDFVYIAENHSNRSFLKNYYKKYLLIISGVILLILLGWLLFSDQVMRIFGEQYYQAKPIITVLMFMVVLAFISRIPIGIILNAVGKSPWNTYSNIVLLVVNIILNAIFIPIWGLIGAAYATGISVFISGLINYFLFNHYLKKFCS